MRNIIQAEIQTKQPAVAASLDQLRYLVFQGMTGESGQSAYALAVELGFAGTEQAWLESLVGPQGAQGEQGVQGVSGPAGPTGADGKNYGVVVDGSADHVLELKSVEAAATEVSSVNGHAGDVVLTAADVGALAADALRITEHPADAAALSDGTGRFHVSAMGSGLGYRWQYCTPSGSWKNCTSSTQGYNTDTLTVQSVTGSINRDSYQYRCVITDGAGSQLISAAATLSVLAVAARTGSYDDLTSKPNIDAAPTADSKNLVTSGGVYTALQSAGRDVFAWAPISVGAGGLVLEAGTGISAIPSVQAWCCRALGMVRVAIVADATALYNARILFGSGSRYLPKLTPYAGDASLGYGHAMLTGNYYGRGFPVCINEWNETYIRLTGDADDAGQCFISGVYFTEDIPTEEDG